MRLSDLIREAFPDALVQIEDLRGDGDHYSCMVETSAFEGKSRVQQHQMVYNSLGGRMGGQLHALALQTGFPNPDHRSRGNEEGKYRCLIRSSQKLTAMMLFCS